MKKISFLLFLAFSLIFSHPATSGPEDQNGFELPCYEFVATGKITIIGWDFIQIDTPKTILTLQKISNLQPNFADLDRAACKGQTIFLRLQSETRGTAKIVELQPIDP